MASDISFRNIGRLWTARRGLFDVVIGSSLGLYIESAAAPKLWDDLSGIFGTHLHACWPERFPAVETDAFDYIVFDRYPRAEREVLANAVSHFLDDLERNTVDPRVDWNPARRDIVIEATQRLVALMRESLAASDLPAPTHQGPVTRQ